MAFTISTVSCCCCLAVGVVVEDKIATAVLLAGALRFLEGWGCDCFFFCLFFGDGVTGAALAAVVADVRLVDVVVVVAKWSFPSHSLLDASDSFGDATIWRNIR